MQPGAELILPWPSQFNALVYALAGDGSIGPDGQPFHSGQLAVHGPGDALAIRADQVQESRHPAFEVLILGGQPIREPVAAHGPFVMNTRDELVQAFEDYQAGRLGTVPADHIGNA
jgi:redox-sensitive bicupin YhaK (pirin superfamily)